MELAVEEDRGNGGFALLADVGNGRALAAVDYFAKVAVAEVQLTPQVYRERLPHKPHYLADRIRERMPACLVDQK